MNIADFKNIAVLHTAFIGDVVLAMPIAQAIRNHNKDCKITFITTPQSASLPKIASAVNTVTVLDKKGKHRSIFDTIRFARELSENAFDLIITPHRYFRSSLISFLQKRAVKVGFDNSVMSLIYDKRAEYIRNIHEVKRNLKLTELFGINEINLSDVELKFSDSDVETVDEICKGFENRFIVMAPGSVWATKRWIESHFVETALKLKELDYEVILSGSDADRELCERIAKASDCMSFAGEMTIPQTILMFRKAKLIITNDSAPTHFAGLVNAPVATIFGATSPIFGFGPLSEKSKIIYNNSLKCSPCRIHGGDKCPLGTHECMKSITPEILLKEIKELI
ncbi:glycosyltransferase family 9 protein [Candidatus Kapaibacterium sp.]